MVTRESHRSDRHRSAMRPRSTTRCGGRYYVNDGHHRIAVARALGQREVWAEVTEVRVARSCLC